MRQIVGHVLGDGVAVGRLLREGLQADPFKLFGNRVVDLSERLGVDVHELLRVGLERTLSGQKLVEDDAEAEDVGSAVDAVPLAVGLLGAHVRRSAGESVALAEVGVLEREAEVGENRRSGRVDEDVGRLYVAMDEAGPMRVMERLGDGRHQSGRFDEAGPRLLKKPDEVGPLDELRDDEAEAVLGPADVEDGDDVRMTERGERARFREKRLGILGPGDATGERHLDRDRPVEIVVVREVDPAEASFAEDLHDAISADAIGLIDRSRCARRSVRVEGAELVLRRLHVRFGDRANTACGPMPDGEGDELLLHDRPLRAGPGRRFEIDARLLPLSQGVLETSAGFGEAPVFFRSEYRRLAHRS